MANKKIVEFIGNWNLWICATSMLEIQIHHRRRKLLPVEGQPPKK